MAMGFLPGSVSSCSGRSCDQTRSLPENEGNQSSCQGDIRPYGRSGSNMSTLSRACKGEVTILTKIVMLDNIFLTEMPWRKISAR